MVIAGCLAAVVLAAGGAAYAMSGSSGPSYRLASVETGSLTQTLMSAGTITSVNQSTVSFPVAGQVATVPVHLGQPVSAGQTLATLSTSALDQQVQAEVAAVASAQQTLARDESAQTTGSTSTSTSSSLTTNSVSEQLLTARPTGIPTASPSAPRPSTAPRGGSTSLATLIAAVKKAQQAVLADQRTVDVDRDVTTADQAVVAEDAACQAILTGSTPTSTPTPTGTQTTGTQTTATPSTSQDLQACQDAIAAVQVAQKQVQHDEDTLAGDEKSLDAAITALLPALSQVMTSRSGTASPPRSTVGSGGSQRTSGSTGGSGSSGSGSTGASRSSATTQVITAAQLAADQQQIDAANAQLEVANQDRAAAVLAAPISGTVAALSITAGADVQAGDSAASITIIGPGVKAVTTTVGINDIDLVKRGDPAQVTVDGVAAPLSGHVSYVGVMNTSGTSGATATYPVTVVLDPTTTPLFDGAGVSTAITLGSVNGVLTVPISAVHHIGTLQTVSVYAKGKVTVERVTVGVSGVDRVQVLTGLSAGQRVVLADISAPVPSNSTLTGRRFGGAGGLGGAAVLGGTGRRGG